MLGVLGGGYPSLKGSEQTPLESDVDLPETGSHTLLSPMLGDQRHVPRLDTYCPTEMLT